uniref:Uncharacterized protein n=1 Tax=Rhizophora mucronata TaxID=61149 RepID=A0A2P2NPK8_RHIMU
MCMNMYYEPFFFALALSIFIVILIVYCLIACSVLYDVA